MRKVMRQKQMLLVNMTHLHSVIEHQKDACCYFTLPLRADCLSASPNLNSTPTGSTGHASSQGLRPQRDRQQAHSPLKIYARVRIGDPLHVLFYLLHDLLQTLR